MFFCIHGIYKWFTMVCVYMKASIKVRKVTMFGKGENNYHFLATTTAGMLKIFSKIFDDEFKMSVSFFMYKR